MSNPSIKITETRSTTAIRSSKLDIQPFPASPIPQAPLMSFDLHFDTLKDYLNSVTNIVNHQGSVLKTVIDELKTRVTTTDIIEIFASISNVVPAELGKLNLARSGDEWKDTISNAIQKLGLVSEKVNELCKFKVQTQDSIQDIHSKLKTKAEIKYVKVKSKKLKSLLKEEIKNKSEMILSHVKEEDDILNGRINELYKMMTDLEQRTLWKLKDCEDLLKVRVNEKYVMDAINGLEDKLKKNLEDMNRGSLAKIERTIKELEKNLEKVQNDTNNKIKATKEDIFEHLNKKTGVVDHENLKKDVEALQKSFKSITDSNLLGKVNDLTQQVHKLENSLNLLTAKVNDENLLEEFENLRSLLDQLKYELDKKADKNLIADMYSKASEPKQDAQEKHDFAEFWKFREKVMEQLKTLEIRIEKLTKSSELSSIKKILGQKANEDDVKTEFSSHDFRILELDRLTNTHSKDIENLLSMLKKLNSSFSDFSSQSGLALLGRKQANPQTCLSCGRGDTNFAPIQQQVLGKDGRVYKADASIGKTTKYAEEGYETGAEVFAMDTHQHAHFRRWEEHETSYKEVKKIPLNVILGKEARKSNSVLPLNTKNRPQSAKK